MTKNFSQLPAKATPVGADLLPIWDTGAGLSKHATLTNIAAAVMALYPDIAAIDALTSAANKLPYYTGAGAAALADFTAAGRALVDDADAAAQRTTLGLGNVENTADASKPVSTAGQAALDLKAPINNAVFTGTTTLAADPASALQAATKQYVDGKIANVGKRGRVRAATTANITIATALNNGDTLDGVTLATGDLVLVKNQSAPEANGIYVVGVTPARFEEFDTYNEHPGALIAVEEGTTLADTLWICTSNDGGTLDTTAIAFTQFTAAGALLAANNLSDLANAATARTNMGVPAASNGTLITPTFSGITTQDGAQVNTASAMGALDIDVTKLNNTKSISADSTLTFSGTPATAQTWFGLRLTNTDSAPHIITIPSSFSMNRGAAITTFPLAAGAKARLIWEYDGSVYNLHGDPGYLNNFAATTAPAVTDDIADGYGPGSWWYDATANILYVCESNSAGAAVWTAVVTTAGTQTLSNKTLVAPALGTPASGNLSNCTQIPHAICIAVGDETTAITTGTAKVTFRMPYAMTLTAVRASLTTVSSSGTPTVDINEGGTTILSTKLTIDASEKTSTTAAAAAVISDTALADDAEITIDIDVAGTGAAGLKVYLIGTKT